MDELPEEDPPVPEPEYSPPADVPNLVLKGVMVIVGAFVSAYIILFLHQPIGH